MIQFKNVIFLFPILGVTAGKTVNPCNLCIDEASIVGLPEKELTEEWTCGTMQLESFDVDASDDLCELMQGFAADCDCHRPGGKPAAVDTTKEENAVESIDIRPRDFDKGFRKKNTRIVDIRDFATKEDSGEADIVDIAHQIKGNDNIIVPENTVERERSTENPLLSHETAMVINCIFLFFLTFALSVKTPVNLVYHNLRALKTGSLMQFFMIPLVGFLVTVLLEDTDAKFTKVMGITLLVVASSPGGSYSNWWCSLFNADVPLSMSMTFVSTILSVGVLPLNLLIYGGIINSGSQEKIKFSGMFITLGVILTGLLIGHSLSYKMGSKNFIKVADRLASLSSMCLVITFLLLSCVDTQVTFWNQDWRVYIGIILVNLMAVFITNIFSQYFTRLEKPECVTLAIECCYKNTSIAMSMVLFMFPEPEQKEEALAIAIIYTIIQKITMLVYCLIAWKVGWTHAPADRQLWVVLMNSYGSKTYTYGNGTVKHRGNKEDTKPVKFIDGDDLSVGKSTDGRNDFTALSLLKHNSPRDEDQEFNPFQNEQGFVNESGESSWKYGPTSVQNFASKMQIGNLFIFPNVKSPENVSSSVMELPATIFPNLLPAPADAPTKNDSPGSSISSSESSKKEGPPADPPGFLMIRYSDENEIL